MKNISTITCKNKKTNEYIRHEYPTNGQYHPFDITCSLQHFLYASGYTYLMEENKTKLIPNIKKVLPKAYMPFDICERCFMISKGEIAWKNPNYNKNELKDYKILSLYKEQIEDKYYSHEIPNTKNLSKDIELIKKRSLKIDGSIYIFVKII